ncbi:hypothetical protein EMIT0P44_430002 [Pseudomonas sp. IT-P44]
MVGGVHKSHVGASLLAMGPLDTLIYRPENRNLDSCRKSPAR